MIKEKKGFIFCFIFVLISLFFIANLSALYDCENDQRIIRLYSESNSHAASWNPSNSDYTIEICYDEIFGQTYTGIDPPHECTGDNKIIGLFSNFNSHAEIPSLNNYPTPVCYGNLTCVKDTTPGIPCSDPNKKVVLRLYNNTNSHVSTANYFNYPIKICCGDTGYLPPPPSENVSWTNMLGDLISMRGAEIEDTVLMRYVSQAGNSYDFKILENDAILDDDIRIIPSTENFDFDSHLSAKWKITQEDYNLGDGLIVGEPGRESEFYFMVNNEDFNHSYDLIIRKYSWENSLPNASITIPAVDDNKYLINSQISFSQGSSDIDDDLNIIWDFNDGNSQEFSDCLTFNRNNCDTNHSYSSSGVKIIKLTAKEMTRSQSAEDSVRILVYQPGINVFGMIDSPGVGEVISGQWADINASSSFVAECSYGECLNPNVIEGCYEVTNETYILYCYDFPKPTVGGTYNIFMQWIFDKNLENPFEVEGYWSTDYIKVVEFDQRFRDPGYHTADLNIGYYEDTGETP